MKRVLIVDDAIDLGRLFQDALKTSHPGIPITVVPSAEEALLEATRLTIDLLVTDIRLPGMTGIELVRKMRVRQPQVKVLMITGITLDDRMQKQLEDISVDFFRRKPLGISEFLAISDELLGFKEPPSQPEARMPEIERASLAATNAGLPSRDDELLKVLSVAVPADQLSLEEKAVIRRHTGALRLPAELELPQAGLSERLSHLRSSQGAIAALLLDERGHVVAQAGDLPEAALLDKLVSPLASALSAAARVSYLLGQPTSNMVQAYRGQLLDLVVTPVGQYTLLVALRPGPSTLRLALSFEDALNAQSEFAQALESMGLRVQKSVEVAAPENLLVERNLNLAEKPAANQDTQPLIAPSKQDQGLDQLVALFEKKSSGEIKLPDIDSFWETAASTESSGEPAPGMLNYDQAQKLGLLPDENKE